MNTKRTFILTFVVAIAHAAMVLSASADFRVKLSDSYGNSRGGGHGGEFLVQQLAGYEFDFEPFSLGETPNRFETFCLERLEFIGFNRAYIVELSDRAIDGGVDGGDPISDETAYLYAQFITGGLTDYAYATTDPDYDDADGVFSRTESANALQNAIWQLEGEIAGYSNLNADESALASAFLLDAQTNSGLQQFSGLIDQVMVMNLTDAQTGAKSQDQLIMVPAPGATLLGLLGLGIVSAFRKRCFRVE